MNTMKRRYIVCDYDGEPLRMFYTKRDAMAFMEIRRDTTLKVLPKETKPEPKRNPIWDDPLWEAPF